MTVSGAACPQVGRPAAVFYPFGHPMLYAYGFLMSGQMRSLWQADFRGKLDFVATPVKLSGRRYYAKITDEYFFIFVILDFLFHSFVYFYYHIFVAHQIKPSPCRQRPLNLLIDRPEGSCPQGINLWAV
jgi:hypothetical protein